MATASGSGDLAVASWADVEGPGSKSDRYLAKRLAAASADYKGVAVTTFLLAACVAAMLWLLFGIGLEHWMIAGGLPRWARWAWLAAGLTGLTAAVVRWIVPLLRYRVNLVYAARAIEADHPELHNDLVNAVLVKAHPQGANARVVRSLERRAAKRLARVPNEGVVDRTAALRLAAALAALVVAAGVYELAAPKSLLVSGARLFAPWSTLAAPTRVSIGTPRLAWRQPGAPDAAAGGDGRPLDGAGGTATLVRGRQLLVSSEIRGLAAGEKPTLVVSPIRDDGTIDQAALWRIPMVPARRDASGDEPGKDDDPAGAERPGRRGRHLAVVPDAVRGLDQSVECFITAGDATSQRLRVSIVDTPSLLVREVRYDYPAYTRREPETVPWQGDLRALEGTRATLVAEGNRPLDWAWIDLDCDGKRDVELRVGQHDLSRATGALRLQMNRERSGPEHGSYRLVFQPKTTAATAREEPVTEKLEHRIEVLPDLPPEVSIEEPREAAVSVPPGAPVTVLVRAVDQDFALASVFIETRLRGGAQAAKIPLVSKPHAGVFRGAGQIVPEKVGAAPGSVLEYRAVAVDNRPEQPNRTESPWQTLRIDPSAPPRQPPAAGRDRAGEARGDAPDRDDPQPAGDSPRGGAERQPRPDDDPTNQGDKASASPARDAPSMQPQEGGAGEKSRAGSQQAADGSQHGKEAGQAATGDPAANAQGANAPGAQAPGGRPQADPAGAGGDGNAADQANNAGTKDSKTDSKAGGPTEGRNDGNGEAARTDAAKGGQGGGGNDKGSEQQPQTGASKEAGGKEAGSKGGSSQGSGQPAAQNQPNGAGRGSKPRETVAADGTNDGEAMERILEHRRRQEEASRPGSGGAGKASQQQPAQPDAKAKPDSKSQDPQPSSGPTAGQPGQSKPGDPSAPSQPAATQKPAACAPADGKPCGKPGCASCGGGANPNGNAAGSSGGAGGREGQDQQGQSQKGQGKQGQGQPGQGQQGAGQQGQGPQGQADAGQGSGEKQEGQPGQSEGRGGEGASANGEPGDGKSSGTGRDQSATGRDGAGKPVADGRQSQKDSPSQPGGPKDGSDGNGQGTTGQGAASGDQAGGSPDRGDPTKRGDTTREGTQQTAQQQAGKEQSGKDPPAEDPAGKSAGGKMADRGAESGQAKPSAAGDRAAGQAGDTANGSAGQQPDGSQPSAGSQVGAGGRTGGRGGTAADAAGGPPPRGELEWTAEDLAHARNAADLAIDHLRDSVESGRRELLDALGWTPEQARAFLDRWQAMRRSAGSSDARQRGEFERTLQSLGIRPGGTRNTRDVPADVDGGQAEGRRSRPPASYREQLKAYLRGMGGE